MNKSVLAALVCAEIVLAGCSPVLAGSGYWVELPEIPPAWASILGEPLWKIEYLDRSGERRAVLAKTGQRVEISLPQTWCNAVSAYPYWVEKGIAPGTFMPAGAVFPFDASGGTLSLSWRGGVDAVLYGELAKAAARQGAGPARAVERLPWNFNWPRFRELFNDPAVNARVRADPWLADWASIAAKIVESGFDKRRLVPEAREERAIPVGCGPWVGVSPFASPLLFEGQPLFPVRQAADTWVSAEGILRCNTGAWLLRAW